MGSMILHVLVLTLVTFSLICLLIDEELAISSVPTLPTNFMNIMKRQANARISNNSSPIDPKNNSSKRWSKWIVVTSVSLPTEDVKRLAALKEWKLCVVADTKTRIGILTVSNFLALKTRKIFVFPVFSMPTLEINSELKLPSLLPYKSYTRKNIGYLYAIMNGAEWIYDTDDDNKPYGKGLEQFDYTERISGMRFKSTADIEQKIFNPYKYFGRGDMWPRGYPLEYIKLNSTEDQFESCAKFRTSAVQQGLVHKDPDVDAIYRLINADPSHGLSVSFDENAPTITLDVGTYAPWNSQNTLFHRDAFFTMFLPTTVEFRATDIWRSFYSQKLLHLVGRTIAFYPVNAIQIRNAHNYLNDFKDENAVYEKSGDIIRFLDKWSCKKETTVACARELAVQFSEHGFWGNTDVQLIDAWLEDLESIGYIFPNLNQSKDYKISCRRTYLHFTSETSKNDLMVSAEKQANMVEIANWCNEVQLQPNATDTFMNGTAITLLVPSEIAKKHEEINDKRETVLVMVSNHPWKAGIGLLQRLYSGFFSHIIFCGTYNKADYNATAGLPPTRTPFSFVHLNDNEISKGYFHYLCVPKVRDLRLENVKGYFFVADDAIFNLWNSVNMSVPGFYTDFQHNTTHWWEKPVGAESAKRLRILIEDKYAKNAKIQALWKEFMKNIKSHNKDDPEAVVFNNTGTQFSDFFFLPAPMLDYASDIFLLMREAEMFLEVGVRKFFLSVAFQELEPEKRGIVIWGKQRLSFEEHYTSKSLFIHPVKPCKIVEAGNRNKFCNSIVKAFLQKLYLP